MGFGTNITLYDIDVVPMLNYCVGGWVLKYIQNAKQFRNEHYVLFRCTRICSDSSCVYLHTIVPTACLTKYYMTSVQSHIDYCSTVWGFTSNKNLNRIQKFQNRAARIITNNFNWDIRGVNIVKDLGWLNIKQRRDYFVGPLVFK